MWNSGARHLTSRIEEKSFERKARISDKAFHPRLENSYAKEGGASWPCLADDSFQRTGSRRERGIEPGFVDSICQSWLPSYNCSSHFNKTSDAIFFLLDWLQDTCALTAFYLPSLNKGLAATRLPGAAKCVSTFHRISNGASKRERCLRKQDSAFF